MNRHDAIEFTLQWVWGVCILWNQHMNAFSDLNHQEFQSFVHRTHNVVWRYLNGRQALDGSCSDFECDTALKARRLFGDKVFKDGGLAEGLIDLGLAEEPKKYYVK
jgi:hypothetical protein